MSITQKVAEVIDTIILLTNAVPGVTGMIMSFVAMLPRAEQQEWTEEKVRMKVAQFRQERDENALKRDMRRTDDGEEGNDNDDE
jgi:hypothetical protein